MRTPEVFQVLSDVTWTRVQTLLLKKENEKMQQQQQTRPSSRLRTAAEGPQTLRLQLPSSFH